MDTERPKLAVLASVAPSHNLYCAVLLFCFSPKANGQHSRTVLFLFMVRHIMGVAFSTEVAPEGIEGARHLPKRGEPLPSVGRRGGPPLYQWRQQKCDTPADEHD